MFQIESYLAPLFKESQIKGRSIDARVLVGCLKKTVITFGIHMIFPTNWVPDSHMCSHKIAFATWYHPNSVQVCQIQGRQQKLPRQLMSLSCTWVYTLLVFTFEAPVQ